MCYEGMNSLQAHNGYKFSISVASTSHCLWHSIECGNFRKPVDKHRVMLFHHVMSAHVLMLHILERQMGNYGANIVIIFYNTKFIEEKHIQIYATMAFLADSAG